MIRNVHTITSLFSTVIDTIVNARVNRQGGCVCLSSFVFASIACELLGAGMTSSNLKMYVFAIAAEHVSLLSEVICHHW